jgi:predicted TIM-barrel fold metal-dependent hydrolase
VTIVLGHAGHPIERSRSYLERWAGALSVLATEHANVVLKISAIASAADPAWTCDTIKPWVLAAIDSFGAERSMLASNWPIDRLYGTYSRLIGAYRAIVADLDPRDRASVLHGTADRVYRLDRTDSTGGS